jgi:hypothetical protein
MGTPKNISKETLIQSFERRLKHIMVQTLDQFDKRFNDISDSERGKLYKFDIKNLMNDAIRASKQEIMDYDVEYRPLRFNPDNTIGVTRTLIEALENIEFLDTPGMRIVVHGEKLKVLESIRYEFGAGVVYAHEDLRYVVFDINGIDNCINLVIPFMDKYKLIAKVEERYNKWRASMIARYNERR